MKHCVNCNYHKRDMVDFPNGQRGLAMLCQHDECTDPVDGSQIPCSVARREELFCGFKGKLFKIKEEPQEAKILQLVKA